MSTFGALAAGIVAADRPTLLLDACAVVDLARAALPNRTRSSGTYADAVRIVSAAEAGDCTRVQASVLPTEIEAHFEHGLSALSRAIRDVETLVSELNVLAVATGLATLAVPNLTAGPHVAELRRLVGRLRRVSRLVPEAGRTMQSALLRANSRRAPAAIQRGEYKGCIIIEEYLALSRALADGGRTKPLVLHTSDTEDLCDPLDKSRLHSDLASDFAGRGLLYAGQWQHAQHLLSL